MEKWFFEMYVNHLHEPTMFGWKNTVRSWKNEVAKAKEKKPANTKYTPKCKKKKKTEQKYTMKSEKLPAVLMNAEAIHND